MDITIPELDLSTEDGAKRAFADLRQAAVTLTERGASDAVKIDKLRDDLVIAQRTLAEITNRSNMTDNAAPGAELQSFVRGADAQGTDAIRWQDETTRDGEDLPGLLTSKPTNEWQTEMQRLAEQRTFVRHCGARLGNLGNIVLGASSKTDRAIVRHMDRAPAVVKRYWADSAGIGAAFVPDILTPQFAEEMTAARTVEALFMSLNAPGKEVRNPFVGLDATPYIRSVTTSADQTKRKETSDPDSLNSFTMTSWAVRTQVDEDAIEDDIIAVLPFHRSRVVKAMVDGWEDTIVNGDTGTHQDNDLTAWNPGTRWNAANLAGTDDHRRPWIGLRARAFDVSGAAIDGNAAQTYTGFMAARANLTAPHSLGDLVCIVSIEHYISTFLNLAEVKQLDDFGPNATVLTGQLGSLGGIPIVPSQFMTQDLNASGLFDNLTTTQGSYVIVNRPRFMNWNYRSPTVQSALDITRGVVDLVNTRRGLFSQVDGAATKNVSLRFNLD